MARRRNIEGVVGIHFEIGIDGSLVSVRVDRSSGSSILDNAAVSLIKKIPLRGSAGVIGVTAINRTLALSVNIEYKLTE
jgi:TonB family protein